MTEAASKGVEPDEAAAPRAEAIPLLEFRNVQVVYDNAIEAVRDVSIAVPEGSIVALLGSNGAGKSTLLKAMSGVLYAEDGAIENGSVHFRGEDLGPLRPDEIVRRGLIQGAGGSPHLRFAHGRGEFADRRLHGRNGACPRAARTGIRAVSAAG